MADGKSGQQSKVFSGGRRQYLAKACTEALCQLITACDDLLLGFHLLQLAMCELPKIVLAGTDKFTARLKIFINMFQRCTVSVLAPHVLPRAHVWLHIPKFASTGQEI